MVISCVHEKDLESIVEVVLQLPAWYSLYIYILLIRGLFRCENIT